MVGKFDFYIVCRIKRGIMSIFCLNVPYDENSTVKSMGAKWCQELKSWYIDDKYVQAKDFIKWIPQIEDTEFKYFAEIELDASGANHVVIMRVKSSSDISEYGYYFIKKERFWQKKYYLNFKYFDSRYPNLYDKKISQLIDHVRQDDVMDSEMIEKFVSVYLEKTQRIPADSFLLRKETRNSQIEYVELE